MRRIESQNLFPIFNNSKTFFSVICLFAIIFTDLSFPFCTNAAQTAPTVEYFSETREQSDTALKVIEQAVEARRRELGIPGLALAIVKDNEVVFNKGFGVRNVKQNLPVTTDTLFAIGSTTKAFTAMATMMSADEGKLALDDSPKKLLPFFKLRDPEADAQVTIRDLLAHRTGLDRTDFVLQFSESMSREEIIKIAGIAKPTAKLKERYQYQNIMYVAAGEAAARANKMSWEKLVEGKIFKPLGMKRTTTFLNEMKKSADHSLGYEYNAETKETRNLQMVDLGKIAPAGAINSSANEMAQWLKFLLGGGSFNGKRLVSEKNFAELFTQQIQVAPKVGYGLGWFVREWRGKKAIEHAGNIDGFNAVVMMIPEEKIGLVLLTNVTANPLTSEIRDIVFENLLANTSAKQEAKSAAPAATNSNSSNTPKNSATAIATLKEITGNYETDAKGTPIDIVAAGDAFSFVMPGQPPRRLFEKEKDIFSIEGLPENYTLLIKRDASGQVNVLSFNQRDGAAVLRSVKLPPNAPTIDELMKRVVEAAGGEANLRKHSSMQIKGTIDLEYEGITGELTTSAKAPNLSVSQTKYFALGRQIGESFDYFDGASGGSFTRDNKLIVGTPRKISGKFLDDARLAADFYQTLDWKTLYKSVELKKVSRIASEDVYVVVKTPASGNQVTDYISQKSFLVLRRETAQPGGGGQIVPYLDNFSDFKTVDGVVLPFKITSGVPNSKPTTVLIKSIEFNLQFPDSIFRPSPLIPELQ
jgi:CubicO group peptidase (beta-lactamase class C family)